MLQLLKQTVQSSLSCTADGGEKVQLQIILELCALYSTIIQY